MRATREQENPVVTDAEQRTSILLRHGSPVINWVVKLEAKTGCGDVETIEVGKLKRWVSGGQRRKSA